MRCQLKGNLRKFCYENLVSICHWVTSFKLFLEIPQLTNFDCKSNWDSWKAPARFWTGAKIGLLHTLNYFITNQGTWVSMQQGKLSIKRINPLKFKTNIKVKVKPLCELKWNVCMKLSIGNICMFFFLFFLLIVKPNTIGFKTFLKEPYILSYCCNSPRNVSFRKIVSLILYLSFRNCRKM